MILPSDGDYKRTKALKKGNKSLQSPFREIADWISNHYSVNVLNVEYDTVISNDRPWLHVIVEKQHEKSKFLDDAHVNFDSTKQKRISDEFISIIQNQGITDFNTDSLFVVFSSFERIARIEANDNIPKEKIEKLKEQLKTKDIWEISRFSDSVTFFFYTDQQLAHFEKEGIRMEFREKYFNLIKPYDEFGYIALKNLPIYLDSKQNFDEKYESNWFYYYK